MTSISTTTAQPMSKTDRTDNNIKKIKNQSTSANVLVVVIAILTLGATSFIQYYYSKDGIKREASLRAESELRSASNSIMGIVGQAEVAVTNSIWVAEWCLENPDSLVRVPQRLVELNPVVVGSTIALVPGYSKDLPLYAPYARRNMKTGKIETLSLATKSYDYPSQVWFAKPLASGKDNWSEPYFDKGGGDMLMTTYSVPVKDCDGRVAAILTADISLDWLTDLMESAKPYPNSYNTVTSANGHLMVCSDSIRYAETGISDESSLCFSTPVERTGWTLSIVIPEKDLFAGFRKMRMIVRLFQLLGIIMIIILLHMVAKSQARFKELNAQKEFIQNELRIGHDIQMSMIPKVFPAFPKRTDIDITASLVPAKDVGGDLYDFYIRDEKLFFCIGDVSGKGVPAALVMTVTQSLFRAISNREESPAYIITAMNDSMFEKNENCMFVTFFCGILDLATGHLRYCNAGHNLPFLVGKTLSRLPVVSNVPLGVMAGFPFKEQEVNISCDDTLFLFTDGITEAENASLEQFGEERLEAALSNKSNAQDLLNTIQAAVSNFVNDAPQSDDLTILIIHYLGKFDK